MATTPDDIRMQIQSEKDKHAAQANDFKQKIRQYNEALKDPQHPEVLRARISEDLQRCQRDLAELNKNHQEQIFQLERQINYQPGSKLESEIKKVIIDNMRDQFVKRNIFNRLFSSKTDLQLTLEKAQSDLSNLPTTANTAIQTQMRTEIAKIKVDTLSELVQQEKSTSAPARFFARLFGRYLPKAEKITDTKLEHLVAVQLMSQGRMTQSSALETIPQIIPSIRKLVDEKIVPVAEAVQLFPEKEEITAAITTAPYTPEHFDEAVKNNNWAKVAEMVNTPWLNKPEQYSEKAVVDLLTNQRRWTDLQHFHQALNKETHVPTQGPMNKSDDTRQLEKLMRKLMINDFKSEHIKQNGQETLLVFNDGETFNWTAISKNANWQQIDLEEADFTTYKSYRAYDGIAYCGLEEKYETVYRDNLYKMVSTKPSSEITMEEMMAINIYTGSAYENMNKILRGQWDFTEGPTLFRESLINSVMCASGLRKLPMTTIQTSYRHERLYGSEEQKKNQMGNLIGVAANKGVMELRGFVSSSSEKGANEGFQGNVEYTFSNLRGVHVAAISKGAHEKEFLILPTQIQIQDISTDEAKGSIKIKASLASDLEPKKLSRKEEAEDKMLVAFYQNNPQHLRDANESTRARLIALDSKLASQIRTIYPVDESMSLATSAENPEPPSFRDSKPQLYAASNSLQSDTPDVSASIQRTQSLKAELVRMREVDGNDLDEDQSYKTDPLPPTPG